ncbi:MAG TPA: helix-hairpin-helix domain-containing protein [Candidatus Dormibacteraeota bacterium]|nr:helix-hairpin-helix domain-containing protein [Candidatus Dormibacteraeota bacterium]
MRNDQYSALLNRIADLLEIKGELFFKVRSYREAARQIDELGEPIDTLRDEGRLGAVHGIGKAIADKLAEYGETGRVEYVEKLEADVPPGLLDFLRIPGLGPRTAKDIYDALGITTLDGLEEALKDGRLRKVPRIRAKAEENIQKGLDALKGHGSGPRTLLPKAMAIADQVVRLLQAVPGVEHIAPAGSLRRRTESIGDIDIVVACNEVEPVMDAFCDMAMVADVLARGQTKSSIRTTEGMQVDLRVVPPAHFGAAMLYFTGSKAHNVRMRALALKQAMTLNEYGLMKLAEKPAELRDDPDVAAVPVTTDLSGTVKASLPRAARRSRAVVAADGEELPSATEEQVFQQLGLLYIPPLLREDRGELALAQVGGGAGLPSLVELADIRGDLHSHTNNSDGKNTIEEMATGAIARGYSYLNVTDHSKSQGIITGIDAAAYPAQVARVRAAAKILERTNPGFRLLCGVEVNVLPDGTLDLPDEVLAEMDVVVASVHSNFRQPRDEMTARICAAARHPHVDIIGHPTGKKVEAREPYDVDLEQVMRAALEGHTALEINASPSRLDLNDIFARRAREMGLKISIGSDAHRPAELNQMEFGIYVAQRAWLGPDDIINCWDLDRLLDWVRQKA